MVQVIRGKDIIKAVNSEVVDREDVYLMRPKKLVERVEKDVGSGATLYFIINKVRDSDIFGSGYGRTDTTKYCLYLYGVLSDGSKTCLIIEGIYPTLDIKVPFNEDPKKLEDMILAASYNSDTGRSNFSVKSIEIIKQFPLKPFQIWPNNYLRITFSCLKSRSDFMRTSFIEKYGTAGDDLNMRPGFPYYFAKVARENEFKTAGWNTIRNYKVVTSSDFIQLCKSGRNQEAEFNRPANGCKYTLRLKIEDIAALTPSEESVLRSTVTDGIINSWIDKDYSILLAWDIETYSRQLNSDDEAADLDTYEIFMICGTIHHPWSNMALSKFCITMLDIDENPLIFSGIGGDISSKDYIIAVNSEKDVLLAFAAILGKFRPEFIVGFNTGRFDWPRVLHKARHYNILTDFYMMADAAANIFTEGGRKNPPEDRLFKQMLVGEKIKIQAGEDFDTNAAEFSGILDTDAMVVFKQLNPTAEVVKYSSLDFYLKKYGLGGKDDMPYNTMFRIYEGWMLLKEIAAAGNKRISTCGLAEKNRSTNNSKMSLKNLPTFAEVKSQLEKVAAGQIEFLDARILIREWGALVAKYCLRDSFACQELFHKSSVIDDKREVADTAHLDLNNAFRRANGSKVQALVGYTCRRFKVLAANNEYYPIAFSIRRPINPLQVTFPGAYVFDPQKGLKKLKPTTALDASSLYPSIIMAMNMSPEKAIRNDKGYSYYIPSNEGKKDIYGIPHMKEVNAADFAQYLEAAGYTLYPIEFTATQGTKQKPGAKFDVSGWVVRHNGVAISADANNKIANIPVTIGEDELIEIGSDIMSHKLKYNVRPALPSENFGVFPYVLKMLKDMRNNVKVDMKLYLKIKETVKADVVQGNTIFQVLTTKFYKDIAALDPIIRSYYTPEQEHEFMKEVEFRLAKLDSKQKAIKVQMNTFYGEQGNYISPINDLLVAGGITTTGKINIKMVTRYLRALKYDILYGDSVPGDEPIIIKDRDGFIRVVQAADLFDDTAAKFMRESGMLPTCNDINEFIKDYSEPAINNAKVLTSKGFTAINVVMRHKLAPAKRLYTVSTLAGTVTVTGDHSLIAPNGEKILGREVDCGQPLLHWDCLPFGNEKLQLETMINRTIVDEKYIYLNDDVFNAASLDILKKYHYTLGMWRETRRVEICLTNKCYIARHVYLCNLVGVSSYWLTEEKKLDLISNSISPADIIKVNSIISFVPNIINNDNFEYVYDLETDNGEFAAGIGRIIVHNTDSSYTSPDPSLFGSMMPSWERVDQKFKSLINV